MEQKIAALTEKLYQEGVEKGEAHAAEIIARAEEDARKIVADAETRAADILENASRTADETRRNVDAELRLSATQAFNDFKQRLQEVVLAKMIDDPVTASLADTATVTGLIKASVEQWSAVPGRAPDLQCLVGETQRDELEASVRRAVSDILAEGIDIRHCSAVNQGFRIGPKDGGFVVGFTDDDFKEFFKAFARPRARKYLFGD